MTGAASELPANRSFARRDEPESKQVGFSAKTGEDNARARDSSNYVFARLFIPAAAVRLLVVGRTAFEVPARFIRDTRSAVLRLFPEYPTLVIVSASLIPAYPPARILMPPVDSIVLQSMNNNSAGFRGRASFSSRCLLNTTDIGNADATLHASAPPCSSGYLGYPRGVPGNDDDSEIFMGCGELPRAREKRRGEARKGRIAYGRVELHDVDDDITRVSLSLSPS